MLKQGFFDRPSVELAPQLLNKLLLVRRPRTHSDAPLRLVGGRIVEVEAYDQEDPASHTFRGPTPRCAVMFGPPGRLYVYRSYGVHWCANVVCGADGWGAAVLIRALSPTHGLDLQRQHRPKAERLRDLCSGPGKLCAALGIQGLDNATEVFDPASKIMLLDDGMAPPEHPLNGPRVGITKAVSRPWRWWMPECHHVSSPRRPPLPVSS